MGRFFNELNYFYVWEMILFTVQYFIGPKNQFYFLGILKENIQVIFNGPWFIIEIGSLDLII